MIFTQYRDGIGPRAQVCTHPSEKGVKALDVKFQTGVRER